MEEVYKSQEVQYKHKYIVPSRNTDYMHTTTAKQLGLKESVKIR